jgi:membrane-associated protein
MHTITDYVLGLGLWAAYAAIFLVLFVECGLLVGFVLPGDSLLLPLGVLAGQGHFNIWMVLLVTTSASIIGNQFGYWFGRRVGPALFDRPDSRIFKKKYLNQAHEFYEKHGAMAVILGRFVPFARTFAPILAGIAGMRRRTFLLYNVVGGFAWCFAVTLLGYYLGKLIPNLDNYILLIVGAILVVSIAPAVVKVLKARNEV